MSNAGPGTAVIVTEPLRIKIVPIPTKTIFYYPTILLAGLMAILSTAFPTHLNTFGQIFLFIGFLNAIVVTFEFPRAAIITVIMTVAAVILGLYLLNQSLDFFPGIAKFFRDLNVHATPQFYTIVCISGVLLIAGVMFMTRFDYWELTPNELIHHHGLLGDVERFATNAMRFNKEITDIFEYMILQSATLHITLPSQPKPITLDNVLFIGHVMKTADQILEGGKVVREEVIQHDHGGAAGSAAAITQDQS
jgi:prepilin signal peptidase PulO-like enzyme (type II secretory pathway)